MPTGLRLSTDKQMRAYLRPCRRAWLLQSQTSSSGRCESLRVTPITAVTVDGGSRAI